MGFSEEFVEAAGPRAATRLSALVRRWARVWQLPFLPSRVQVKHNARLRSTVARYLKNTRTIEVGPRFFSLRTRQIDVLAHEMAHAAIDFKHGQAVNVHGQEWQSFVRAVGFTPRARLTTAGARPKRTGLEMPPLYAHRCPVCHMLRLSKRPIKRWRCRSCVEAGLEGTLKITRVAREK
jgi:predicted SprT family Zn-dependent metalloprotease